MESNLRSRWKHTCRGLALAAMVALPLPARALDADTVTQVLAYGLAAIETRALDPVTLSATTLEGLRGLSGVEPGLVVRRDGDDLLVTVSGHEAGRWPIPARDTPEAWGTLTWRIVAAIRERSPAVARMDAEALYQAFFDSALAPLDPFSRYAGRVEAERQQETRNGFGGVGIRYRLHRDHLEITSVLEGTPAEEAGLEPGDRVVRIGETEILDLTRKAVHDLLRGPVDSRVRLAVRREGREITADLRRGRVSPPTAFLRTGGDILRLTVTRFSRQTAELSRRLIEEALADPRTARPIGLILDMRGNPGGLMDQGVALADLFMTEGEIVTTRGRHPATRQGYQATRTDVPGGDLLHGLPILVLVDGRTASAAEITAAALQANGRAAVIGTTTYGKGTVQTVVAMPNGGEMTLTWSRFFTPTGYALHGLGVMPNLCTAAGGSNPEELMRVLTLGQMSVAATYAKWRTVPLTDAAGRRALRQVCPPEDHGNRDALDLDLAIAVLETPGAYRNALAALETPDHR